jgi:hypothetical protein
VIGGRQRFGTIAAVTLRPCIWIFQQMLGQILLISRTSTKDVELLVLQHEVAMPGRTNSRARAGWADRASSTAMDCSSFPGQNFPGASGARDTRAIVQ